MLPVGFRTVRVEGSRFLINNVPFYFKGFGKIQDSDVSYIFWTWYLIWLTVGRSRRLLPEWNSCEVRSLFGLGCRSTTETCFSDAECIIRKTGKIVTKKHKDCTVPCYKDRFQTSCVLDLKNVFSDKRELFHMPFFKWDKISHLTFQLRVETTRKCMVPSAEQGQKSAIK